MINHTADALKLVPTDCSDAGISRNEDFLTFCLSEAQALQSDERALAAAAAFLTGFQEVR